MRLDISVFNLSLCGSRSAATALIKNGQVSVNGKTVLKPSFEVSEDDKITIFEGESGRYVSRGGLKLEKALDFFKVGVTGLTCCDIGASTGGFTDCLLKHGAKKVFAVDCGHGQLHPSLLSNPSVISLEGINAKELTFSTLNEKVDIVVMDVSFISQTKLYPSVCSVLKDGGMFISLIKPQFEVGKSGIGKGGIVKNDKIRESAKTAILESASLYGLKNIGITDSPISGGDGNHEYLACFVKENNNED